MKKTIILSLIIFCSIIGNSQDIEGLFKAPKIDLNYLFDGYMSPFGKAFGKAMNAGWYNTAKVHSFLGFDITIGVPIAMVPSSDKTFTISDSKLTTLKLVDKSKNEAQTFFGKNESGAKLSAANFSEFNMPVGTGLAMAFAIAPQIGFGLPMGFEIKARFIPQINFGDKGKVGLWGLALRHDVLQYIPIVDKLPFLNLSAMVAYSNLKSNISLSQNTNSSGQEFKTDISAWTTNIAASADFPFISLHASLGLGGVSSSMDLNGNFDIKNDEGIIKTESNPLSFDKSYTDFRANAGLKFKIFLWHIFTDYTYDGGYNIVTVGTAISFR